MAREVTTTTHGDLDDRCAWLVGFLIFFPILWMVLTSFKTELEAFAMPPIVPVLPLDHGELRRPCRSAATISTTRSIRSSSPAARR